MISVHNISKSYGKHLVDDLTLTISSGELFAFLESQWCWQNNYHKNDGRIIATHPRSNYLSMDIVWQRIIYLPKNVYICTRSTLSILINF